MGVRRCRLTEVPHRPDGAPHAVAPLSAIAGTGYKDDGASRTTCGLATGGVLGRAAERGQASSGFAYLARRCLSCPAAPGDSNRRPRRVVGVL